VGVDGVYLAFNAREIAADDLDGIALADGV
jgi:hypothetical protein